nr:MAG TPA: hypothetical protein [Caudoviricetes sp.]
MQVNNIQLYTLCSRVNLCFTVLFSNCFYFMRLFYVE